MISRIADRLKALRRQLVLWPALPGLGLLDVGILMSGPILVHGL